MLLNKHTHLINNFNFYTRAIKYTFNSRHFVDSTTCRYFKERQSGMHLRHTQKNMVKFCE